VNCRLSLAVSRVPVSVAVGMPIARHPPHRPVLARLTHTVLTLEAAEKCGKRQQRKEKVGCGICANLLIPFN